MAGKAKRLGTRLAGRSGSSHEDRVRRQVISWVRCRVRHAGFGI